MQDTEHPLAQTVRQLYEAANQGDDSLRSQLWSSDIVWHVPGNNPVAGDYRGQEAYFRLLPSRMAPLEEWHFSIQHLMVNGNYVLAWVHIEGKRKGQAIRTPGANLFRFEQGKVAEGWGFVVDQAGLDRFFWA